MIKKTITYVDYNGDECTDDFYFNLSKAELTEMELGTPGGLTAMVRRAVSSNDSPEIVKLFKEMMLKAYGEKSPDGKRFVKSKELTEKFLSTMAYSELFMELATNIDAATEFFNGLIPSDMKVQSSETAALVSK